MFCLWLGALAMGMTHPLVTYVELGTVPPELFDWLLEFHAPPDFDETVTKSLLNKALIKSTQWGHSNIVQLLLQKEGVDVNAKDEERGFAALHVAALLDQVGIAELLLEFNADVDLKEEGKGSTALHIASDQGSVAMAELLIRVGADVNAKQDEMGSTPLHLATWKGRLSVAKLLKSLGADVNANDECGDTPLHDAVSAHQMGMVAWLGQNGADLNAKNANDQTPITIALNHNRMDIVKTIWNAAYSKLEDLEKETNSPVLSLLEDAFAGEEPHLAAIVLKYLGPPNFEDLKVANKDRLSIIESMYVNDSYEDLHTYIKMLEEAKEQQQLRRGIKRKFLEPLHSGGSPSEARVQGETASADDKKKRKKE